MTIWAVFLVLLPWREGSGSAEGLLTAHLAFLLAAALSWPRAPRRALLVLALTTAAAAALSGAIAPYRFATILAVVDLTIMLGVIVLVEAEARRRGDAMASALQAIVLCGCAQAGLVLVSWAGSGLRTAGAGTLLNSDHAAAYLLLALWALAALGRDGFASGPTGAWSASSGRVAASSASAASAAAASASSASASGAALLSAAGVAILAAALLQASRGALLALLVSGALYLVLRWRDLAPRRRVATLAAAALVIAAGGSLLALRFATREDPYRWDRLRLWGAALSVACDHPLMGCGPGVFAYVTPPYDPPREGAPVRYGKHVEATHSDYLRVLAETGLLGCLAFLALGAAIVRGAIGAMRGGGAREAALGAAGAGLAVHMAVENLSARPAVAYTGAAMLALLLAKAPAAGSEEAAAGSRRALARRTQRSGVVLAVLGLGTLGWVGIALVIAPYLGHRAYRRFLEGGREVGASYAAAVFWNPIHPEYRAAIGRAVLAAPHPSPEDLRAGLLAADEAQSLMPADPSYRLLKARLARRAHAAGRGDQDWITIAEEEYARADLLDPHRPQARLERGWMRLGAGRAEDGLADARSVRRSEPNHLEAMRLEAEALAALGRIEGARLILEEALTARPTLAAYRPANDYESAVLRWDEEGWKALAGRLAAGG